MKFETNLHLCFFDSNRATSDTKRAGKHRPQWFKKPQNTVPIS